MGKRLLIVFGFLFIVAIFFFFITNNLCKEKIKLSETITCESWENLREMVNSNAFKSMTLENKKNKVIEILNKFEENGDIDSYRIDDVNAIAYVNVLDDELRYFHFSNKYFEGIRIKTDSVTAFGYFPMTKCED